MLCLVQKIKSTTNNKVKKTTKKNSITNNTIGTTKTSRITTKTTNSYNKNDWLHKEYYNYTNSIGEAEFGFWYDRAPITKKPYTNFDDIPDSDYFCSIYSGDHYFRLGETKKVVN